MPPGEEVRTGVMPSVPLANAIFFAPMFHEDEKEGGVIMEDSLGSQAFVRGLIIVFDTKFLELAARGACSTALD